MNKIPALTFHNGGKIPQLAFGTYKLRSQSTRAVADALALGYRHIDGATIYKNQKDIGRIIKDSKIPREELFVTSKVWTSGMSKQGATKSLQSSLKDLQLNYLDLLLIHWPSVDGVDPQDGKALRAARLQTWKALIELKRQGKTKNIGVSNFFPKHIEPLFQTSEKPVVNQIMINPYYVHEETVAFCKTHQILLESWSPLAQAKHGLLQDPIINSIAKRLGKSAAQVCLRWNIQYNNIILPKSQTPSRIQENSKVFDFHLTQQDMKLIDGLHKSNRIPVPERMNCE